MTNPEQIGRYEIDRRIGQGGMAVIYLALDPLMKRTVAIKLLPRQSLQDPTYTTRFQREVETLAALEHPGIVPIYDYGIYEDQPYYVMRYMSGGSLADRLRQSTQGVPETAMLIRQIAPALDSAHRRSIVHRDIKPGNILFDAENHAYLSDFGIVKIASGGGEVSGGSVMGTPSYMSPELARGDVDVDGRSDIYAVGVLLFRIWAGVTPFTANTPMGIAMKHVTDPVPDILDYQPDLPKACTRFIETAMAKDRDARFYSALELSNALDQIASGNDWVPSLYEETISDFDRISRKIKDNIPAEENTQSSRRTNLPAQTSSFIGRQVELTRISELLSSEDCRLLTLLGPGGIGKTRLAIQAASDFSTDFIDGVYFVPLAPVQSGERVTPTIADSIDFSFYGEEDQLRQLTNYLRTKNMLLVVDNFEHLMDEARILPDLLASAPGVKVLVTSRERLNLQEEWIIQVHGMDLPRSAKPDDLQGYPAIELFLDRVRKLTPTAEFSEADLPYAVRICQLIEGSPLGIELAAAWTRFFSLSEIASEIEQSLDFLTSSLRNISPRHRSLRAVFNYSWELLEEPVREMFSMLAIFHGGFTRNMASHIAGTSMIDLVALTDKSLIVRHDSGRFEMPEVIRQYAEEKLNVEPEVRCAVHDRFARYFMDYLQNFQSDLEGLNQQTTLETLRTEIANIRYAWHWAVEQRQWKVISVGYKSLYRYLEFRGRIIEGRETFVDLSSRLDAETDLDEKDRKLRANAHARTGAFLYRLGKPDLAKPLLENSLAELRNHGEQEDIGFALTYLGAVEYLIKNYSASAAFGEESVNVLKETSDRIGFAIAYHHLGLLERDRGDFAKSQHLFNESLVINQEIGNSYGEAISLNNLGIVAYEMGDYDKANILHNLSLEIRKKLDDNWGIANVYDGLGLVAFHRGDLVEADAYFEESLEIYTEIGDERRAQAAEANLMRVRE